MRQLTVKLAVISFRRLVLSSLICLLLLTTLLHFHGHVFAADSPIQSNPLNEAEQWILAQVTAGKVADLKTQFPNESDRVLSASFLQDLFMGAKKAKVGRFGVQIANGIMTEPVTIELADIPFETQLTDFEFEENVDFSGSVFLKGISFTGSSFRYADFSEISVGHSADFNNVIFHGSVSFNFAKINCNFSANGAKFLKQVYYSGLEVGGKVLIKDARFWNKAIFEGVDVKLDFEAKGARFNNHSEIAFFQKMKVGGEADFGNVTFAGPVNLRGIKVGSDAHFNNTLFKNDVLLADMDIHGWLLCENTKFNSKADFTSMNIGGYALFLDSVFSDKALFADMDIHGWLLCENTTFIGEADFTSMNIGGYALFSDSVFSDKATFVDADISDALVLRGTRFDNEIAGVFFRRMKVGGVTNIRGTVFKGPVDFRLAEIEGSFLASYVRFNNDEKETTFRYIKVRGDSDFTNTIFRGPVDFNLSNFGGNLAMSFASFFNEVQGVQLVDATVQGTAEFNETSFYGPVDMTRSNFVSVDFTKTGWPDKDKPHPIQLEGITYQDIRAGDEERSCKKLLELVSRAEYRPSVYAGLESFFRNSGDIAKADEIFVAQKRRERNEILGFWQRGLSQFLDTFVKYGRDPGRVIIPIIPPLGIGFFIFRKKHMTLKEPFAPRQPRYSVFWYTFDLFIPFVDLKVASAWTPTEGYGFLTWFRRHYVRVHIFLGWILIPIGLLALIGIIK